jgi:hypothetical protein
MFLIVATLAVVLPPSTPAIPKATQVRVSASIVRAAEASARSLSTHRPDRVRAFDEKLSDGHSVRVVILDFE